MKLILLLLLLLGISTCCSAFNHHLKYVHSTIVQKDATPRIKNCTVTVHVNSTLDIIPTAFFAFSEEEDEPRSYKRLIYPFINRGCDIVAQHPTFLLFRCRIETKMGKCLGGYYLARITQFYEIVTKVISATQFKSFKEQKTTLVDCSESKINNITARKNDSNSVYVEWKYSKELDRPRYCPKARVFSVRFVSYADSSANIVANTSKWYDTKKRRLTNYTFSGLDLSLFYKFEVRRKTDVLGTLSRKESLLHYFQPQSQAHMDTGDRTIYATLDSAIDIDCKAEGVPTPDISYYRLDNPSLSTTSLSFKAVKLEDSGTYQCQASNNYFNMQKQELQEINKIVTITLVVYSGGSQCVSYSSDFCSDYIRKDWPVFLSDPSIMSPIENLVAQVDNQVNVSSECSLFAKSYLCHSHLPYCNPTATFIKRPLEVCPQVCKKLREKCASEFEPGSALYEKLFSSCDNASRSPGDLPGCIYIDSEHPLKDGAKRDIAGENKTVNCIIGNGRTYRGTQSFTESGHQCQIWESDFPQNHRLDDDMNAELRTAFRDCRNPGGLESRPWCFVSNQTAGKRWEHCDIPPCITCVPYTGELCTPLGYTNESLVYLETHLYDSHSALENNLLGALIHVEEEETTPGCQNALRQLVCYGLMPTCNGPVPKRLCREHCSLLTDIQFCSTAVLERVDTVRAHLIQKCRSISADRTQGECMSATDRVKVANDSEKTTTCYHSDDLGQSYQGTEDIAENGRCLPWALFQDTLSPSNFPELKNANNYCRNPGRLGRRPWCFSTAGGGWSYCNVTVCGDEADPLKTSTKPLPVVAMVVTIAVVVIILAFVVIVAIYMFRDKRRVVEHQVVENNNITNYDVCFKEHTAALKQDIKSFRKIDRLNIQYMKQLGGGNFGVVFLGKCKGLENGEESTLVAVKTLKEESSNTAVQDFIQEAKLLHRFDHPHIVCFHGVCMEELPYYLVFEYMDQGDLCQFLRMHGSSAQRCYNPPNAFRDRTPSTVSTDSASLGVTQLLDICKQVASGMAYLESEKHIHRDLSCRNCLIKTGMIVKVADFGMAQKLYAGDYIRINGQVVLPIRWMSPESIVYGTFSSQSDVWSFGVVVWEVFSFALQPYWGFANSDVTDMVRRGKLLLKPVACPENLFSFIKESCWHQEPSQRLTFADLLAALGTFRLSDSDSSDFSADMFDDNDATVFDDVCDDTNKED